MRVAVQDLFNLYLGRSSNVNTEESAKEASLQLRKRITAINRDLPPRNEQFLLHFQQLQAQFWIRNSCGQRQSQYFLL